MSKVGDPDSILKAFLADVRSLRASGQATPERSYYPAIRTLLDGLLAGLRPLRRAITDVSGIDREFPDLGVIETDSNVVVLPVEAKSATPELTEIVRSAQALKYARTFGGGVVLVTNLRQFAVARIDPSKGGLLEEERVSIVEVESDLDSRVRVDQETATALVGMLDRACQVRGSLGDPADVAVLLAFHAGRIRDAVEATGHAAELLEPIHTALKAGLHIDVEPQLLVPTVVQTLVYGLFASWLESTDDGDLDWMETAYRLDVPVFADVLHAALRPALIRQCDLKRHLNAASRVLSWVDREKFTAAFDGDAIQYFYEPFLAAFDPVLRDRLGVWYTPRAIADYQVARVDHHVRYDLGVAEGLAASSVYALDPACGTGTYLAALIRLVYQLHVDNGEPQAVAAARAREAAITRVIGFEILPAAFIVCHLHLSRVLAQVGAPPLGTDRLRVYLTNSLTGWTDDGAPTAVTLFPELEQELREAAVAKHRDPILAIVGNPPYEGYSTAEDVEERALVAPWVEPLWEVWGIRKHRLNDLYVRFWRMAVNRIVDITGRGVVSFISNRKWLGGRSYPAMRETIATQFQNVYVDDLHGGVDDRTHAGDQSVFTTDVASGITRGTAIVTAVRLHSAAEGQVAEVSRRDLRGSAAEKRARLETFGDSYIDEEMARLTISKESRWRFIPDAAGDYPPLDDYLPFYLSGVQPVRDEAVLDDYRAGLAERMRQYFDRSISWGDLIRRYPGFAVNRARYDGPKVRARLLASSTFRESRIVRFLYRPFDSRWLYWEPDHKLLNEARRQLLPYWENVERQQALVLPQTPRRNGAPRALSGQQVASFACGEPDARVFPLYRPGTLFAPQSGHELPLGHVDESVEEPTMVASAWIDVALTVIGITDRKVAGETVFYALLAVLNSPEFLDTLPVEMDDFPQVPIPSDPGALAAAAQVGRQLASLYDPDEDVPSVTTGMIESSLRDIGVPDTMTGKGRLIFGSFGETGGRREGTDVLWDEHHGWRNVPDDVWKFTVNGHNALPKWLSYRKDRETRPHVLTQAEREHFMHLCRRIASIVACQPACDTAWKAAAAAPLGL